MKIAVLVKEVPGKTAGLRHDPASKRLIRDGDQVLNSYDAHAVEAALQLRESGGATDATVTAICMGPASAARTLQKALALGADDAVHVTDGAFAGSDILATARALAAAVARGGFDLVLLGQQAGDSDCWALPGMLAELLQMPVLTQASKLELEGSSTISVERQTEAGYEKLAASLPAIVSVADSLNTPRYPSLKAIMGAKKKPLEAVGPAELSLDAAQVGEQGSGTVVLAFTAPPAKSHGTKIEDDGSAADQIVAFLASKSLI